ncbi:hypothetical protein CFS9_25090 [Flavobacterium sp. CFS9]|uniref:Uncharacterized protein n=1 Tax=Flavobacterium sp. CFS9 TaxID=3143118 RepID=A0AAT9H319_9FLAO
MTFKPSNANAEYFGYKNGKYHINFDITDFEVTKSNVRALTIHEAYGHGDINYGDDKKNHYRAYTATIDSKYWETTTYEFKHNQVQKMWSYFYNEVGNQRMREKYMIEYDKYIKRR